MCTNDNAKKNIYDTDEKNAVNNGKIASYDYVEMNTIYYAELAMCNKLC